MSKLSHEDVPNLIAFHQREDEYLEDTFERMYSLAVSIGKDSIIVNEMLKLWDKDPALVKSCVKNYMQRMVDMT